MYATEINFRINFVNRQKQIIFYYNKTIVITENLKSFKAFASLLEIIPRPEQLQTIFEFLKLL